MQKVAVNFKREVERWRTGSAIAWTLLLLPPIMSGFLLMASFSVLHPIAWIVVWTKMLFSFGFWGLVISTAGIVCLVAVVDSKHFSVKPVVMSNRWEYLCQVLSPRRLLQLAEHALASGAIVWCYTQWTGKQYNSLTLPCEYDPKVSYIKKDHMCLNEQHLFLVIFGACVGALYIIRFHLTNQGHLVFPVIQQPKFFQAKSKFPVMVQNSIIHVAQLLFVFCFLYYLCLGSFFKRLITDATELRIRNGYDVNSFRGIFDINLMWHAFLSTTLVHILLSLSSLLLKIYHTEPNWFPIESIMETDENCFLQNTLTCNRSPLVQYLGYLDLFELSKHSTERRQEVFNLSQPGGHPHNWNAISSTCLDMLKKLTADIHAFNDNVLVNGPSRQMSNDVTSTPKAMPYPETLTTQLTYRGPQPQSPTFDGQGQVKAKPKSVKEKMIEHLKKRKAIAFFITDLPDSASRRLYADCQLYIWAAEAMSNLTVASYTEDQFGVVQKSLPDVLTTLLSLQEAVDKQLKLAPPSVNRKAAKPGDLDSEIALRFALKTSLRSAIYRIVITFDQHLSSLSLPVEHSRRIKLYQEFKE